MQEHQINEVDIISAEQVDVEEVEMDEIWSFVHDKSQQYWLWWAIDHQSGIPLAHCFGMREHRNLDELRTLLAPFHIKTVYADGHYAYKSRITESTVVTGKKNTHFPSHLVQQTGQENFTFFQTPSDARLKCSPLPRQIFGEI